MKTHTPIWESYRADKILIVHSLSNKNSGSRSGLGSSEATPEREKRSGIGRSEFGAGEAIWDREKRLGIGRPGVGSGEALAKQAVVTEET